MARLSPNHMEFNILTKSDANNDFWTANEQRFKQQITAKVPKRVTLTDEGSRLMIMIEVENPEVKLNHETNEHYHIEAYENTGVVLVKIRAETIFGARHALETLSQLVVFDNIRNELQIVGEFEIDDKPVFKHRGVLLDTSRNYFSVESIKRTIGRLELERISSFFFGVNLLNSFCRRHGHGKVEHIPLAYHRFAELPHHSQITSWSIAVGSIFAR